MQTEENLIFLTEMHVFVVMYRISIYSITHNIIPGNIIFIKAEFFRAFLDATLIN